MVWWLHDIQNQHRRGVHFGLKALGDIVYQTLNIMLECGDYNYDGYDIHALTNVGVNIFNVDLTKNGIELYEKIRTAMHSSHMMPEMIPSSYYTPVGLSVTMSVNKPFVIDERVDIIILKDVITTDQLRKFKKENKQFSLKPILFWPPTLQIEDLNELIKIAEGLVLDPSLGHHFHKFKHVMRKCKEVCKPIFYMSPSMIEDYYQERSNDRQILIQVHELVEHRLDGIYLGGCEGKPPLELIQALVRSTEIVEQELHNPSTDYFKLSLELKLPVLQPFSVALGASLAALQSGASAIIVFTTTGASARIISSSAPPCLVLGITTHETTARKMHMYRKVIPLHYREKRANCWHRERLSRIGFGTQFGIDTGLFNFGAKLVVLAPSVEGDVYCNGFQISCVARILNAYKCGEINGI